LKGPDVTTIAITGAAGTIGAPLARDLVAHGFSVVRIDRTAGPETDLVLDVQDLEALTAAVRGCETIVHLAGIPDVTSSWADVAGPGIAGTYNAYEAARRAGCTRVIFASSNHAVGMYEVDNLPGIYEPASGTLVGVGAELRPDSMYGVWKVFGEATGRYYSDAHGLQVTCVRIGSITKADDPRHPSVAQSSGWLPLSEPEKFRRYAATWMSQADFCRLTRAILAKNVRFSIVYGVGDNANRFWDLEPGRATFGWWPLDGVRADGTVVRSGLPRRAIVSVDTEPPVR
jgi:nucleoside-diphosphate-sugar epimerase